MCFLQLETSSCLRQRLRKHRDTERQKTANLLQWRRWPAFYGAHCRTLRRNTLRWPQTCQLHPLLLAALYNVRLFADLRRFSSCCYIFPLFLSRNFHKSNYRVFVVNNYLVASAKAAVMRSGRFVCNSFCYSVCLCTAEVISRFHLNLVLWLDLSIERTDTDSRSLFHYHRHCGIRDFRNSLAFINISRTVTGRFSRHSAKWLTPTR